MDRISKRFLAWMLCIAVSLSFGSAVPGDTGAAYAKDNVICNTDDNAAEAAPEGNVGEPDDPEPEEPASAVTVEMGSISGTVKQQAALISWDAAKVTTTDENGEVIPNEAYELSYHVYRKEGAAGYEEIAATEDLQHKDIGLKEETRYRYYVSCIVSFDGEQYSSETEPTPALFYLKSVSRPFGLQVRQTNPLKKKLTVSWKKAENAQKYMVYRKRTDGSWKRIKTVTGCTYTDLNTAFRKRYRYKIKAYREFGGVKSESVFSEIKTCSVKLPKVSRPYGVKIRQKDENKSALTVSWKKAKNAQRYMVYRKKSGGSWHLIKTTSKRRYKDKTTKFDKKYRYRIKAYGVFQGVKSKSRFSKTKSFKVKVPRIFNIKVKNINQYKIGYNMGCEIVSLAILLQFMGFSPESGKAMCDLLYYKLTRKGNNDLYTKYYGNPHGNGSYGACYETVIRNTAINFFKHKKSQHKVKAYRGKSLDYLLKNIWKGRPVIIWVTEHMKNSRNYRMSGGIWNVNAHTLVLTGYNRKKGLVYVADPERGNVKYKLSTFKDRYALRGKRAVVVY